MATPPSAPKLAQAVRERIFRNTRIVILLGLSLLMVSCLVFSWTTRDAMANLPFLGHRARSGRDRVKKTIVDLRPWQTAQALAPLAVTAEEKEFARNAQRLADHEVDQAFGSALRQATLQAKNIKLNGEALALSQKVAQLQQLIKQDQAQVDAISAQLKSPATGGTTAPVDAGDLDVAKAQLGLDTDQLADANQDLDRATGDQTAQIQAELSAHEASMSQYDKQVESGGDIAVVSAKRRGTLASRVNAWFDQRDRYQLLQQALAQTNADIATLSSEHNALEAKANAAASPQTADQADHSARLAEIKGRSAERQILAIYDDRIQTNQQLAFVYNRWSAQVLLQHRIVLHMILQSVAFIAFIGICVVLLNMLVRRIMDNRALDGRRSQTLRSILQLSIQVAGALCILLVIFGTPRETPTILGLATAALTIALQDYIIAFLGWFSLMGRNGIHVGDWVEINGVDGEVTDVRLFTTTLLETGTLADKGLPTGRRITFMNGFAIRGKYFNFTTSGQWMWDQITLSLPPNADIQHVVESIHAAALQETEQNVRTAEQEWKRGAHGAGMSRFTATPVEILLPSGSGLELQLRYVTRASERFDLRNRLYQKIVGVLRGSNQVQSAPAST